jgi:hypothetical protein
MSAKVAAATSVIICEFGTNYHDNASTSERVTYAKIEIAPYMNKAKTHPTTRWATVV